jgi:hypothetical protein
MSDLLARARNYLDSNDDPAIAGDLIVDFIGEVERLRAALTEISDLAMRNPAKYASLAARMDRIALSALNDQ